MQKTQRMASLTPTDENSKMSPNGSASFLLWLIRLDIKKYMNLATQSSNSYFLGHSYVTMNHGPWMGICVWIRLHRTRSLPLKIQTHKHSTIIIMSTKAIQLIKWTIRMPWAWYFIIQWNRLDDMCHGNVRWNDTTITTKTNPLNVKPTHASTEMLTQNSSFSVTSNNNSNQLKTT